MNVNFFNIEGRQLDKEQIESSIYIGNQLVIAGAGAGKTLSIVGKVKYLLEEIKVKPSEILLLAFTDKVVNELKERIAKVVNKKIDILTFHKLGMKIFNKSDNQKEIATEAFYNFVYNYFYKGIYEEDIEFASGVYNFVHQNYNESEIVDIKEIKELTNNINGYTLNGEKTASVVALITCNMLFLNGIKYEYIVESKYRHYIKLSDNKYIYFTTTAKDSNCLSLKGVNHFETPKTLYFYLNQNNFYINGYQKYTYYLDDAAIVKRFTDFFNSIVEAEKITSAADVYEHDFDYFIENYCNNKLDCVMFINLFRFVRKKFYKHLSIRNETDFNHMIYGPIEILKRKKFLPYKYIIVDEYQDISPARYNLLVELLNQNNGCLMAYGDDWQSIYSFSGSNNKFFMNFCDKLPDAKEFYLKYTYRNSQQLIDVSAKFVMLNPCQKSKNISSNKNIANPIKVLRYQVSNLDSLLYTLEDINKIENGNKVSLMVLGRTNYAIDMIKYIKEISYLGEDDNGKKIFQYEGYSNIFIQFLTIHRAKGLEADYVFVTGVNDKDMPLEIDERRPYINILSKLNEYEEEKEHEKYEGLPSSEERRLFYVALTRTKNIVYLSTPNLDNLQASPFVKDLVNESKDKIEFADVIPLYNFQTMLVCPSCGGQVQQVSKKGRKFCFCENKCKVKADSLVEGKSIFYDKKIIFQQK